MRRSKRIQAQTRRNDLHCSNCCSSSFFAACVRSRWRWTSTTTTSWSSPSTCRCSSPSSQTSGGRWEFAFFYIWMNLMNDTEGEKGRVSLWVCGPHKGQVWDTERRGGGFTQVSRPLISSNRFNLPMIAKKQIKSFETFLSFTRVNLFVASQRTLSRLVTTRKQVVPPSGTTALSRQHLKPGGPAFWDHPIVKTKPSVLLAVNWGLTC